MKRRMSNQQVCEEITERIVAQLEAGVVPWHRTWASSEHRSIATGKPYRGVNIWLLRKRVERKVEDDSGDEKVETFWLMRFHNVFNVEQTNLVQEGKLDEWTPTQHDPITECEALWSGWTDAPPIVPGEPAYSPFMDRIEMPALNAFESPEAYYATLFHEGVHATGHENRLAREGVTDRDGFGTERYGKEELVAEMGAAMLAGLTGIKHTTERNSASYIASWIRTIKGDPKLVVSAASQAQKAVDYITANAAEEVVAA